MTSTLEDLLIDRAVTQDARIEDLQIQLDAAKRENEELRAELEAAKARINTFYVGG